MSGTECGFVQLTRHVRNISWRVLIVARRLTPQDVSPKQLVGETTHVFTPVGIVLRSVRRRTRRSGQPEISHSHPPTETEGLFGARTA